MKEVNKVEITSNSIHSGRFKKGDILTLCNIESDKVIWCKHEEYGEVEWEIKTSDCKFFNTPQNQ